MGMECIMENSIEVSPEIKNLAVLLDVHIQKKQSQEVENACALVWPSEQCSQDNEITQRVDRENVVSEYREGDATLCGSVDKPRHRRASDHSTQTSLSYMRLWKHEKVLEIWYVVFCLQLMIL